MGQDFWKTVRTIAIVIILGAGLWFALKWFGGVANENAGDTAAQKAEQQIDDQ